jgi:hypothetical protein
MFSVLTTAQQQSSVAAVRQWGARFISNLYSDGQSGALDHRLTEQKSYRRLRAWIVANRLESPFMTAIRAVHTAVFAVIMGLIVHFTYSAIRDRVSWWGSITFGLIVGEGVVLGVNGGRCPLTVVVEDLGADHGEVVDIFLPKWVARHIAHISTALLGIGLMAVVVHRSGFATRARSVDSRA